MDGVNQMALNDTRPPGDSAGVWARALWLDGRIRQGSSPSLRDVQDQFGVGRRTVLATVRFLKDTLGAPLVYRRSSGGYAYSDPTYALPSAFLEEGELLALFVSEH